MRNILVTGGAGYIGSHACAALAAAGYTPVSFDNLHTGWREAVQFGPLITGDLRDRAAIEAALRQVQPVAVLHFAALIEVGASMRTPAEYWDNNVGGTRTLLEAMRATGVDRLIFSSTCAVNGDLDGQLMSEDLPFAPASAYGATKAAAEMMLSDYARAYGLRTLALRYFNVAGADPQARIGEFHQPETHLIPLVLQAVRGERAALKVFGADYPTRDGTCIRDYIHVCDLADAHVSAIDYLARDSRVPVICLGTGQGMSVREIIAAAAEVTGQSVPHEMAPRRPGDPASLVSGSERARAELGWVPARSTPDQMIGDAWRWHQGPGYTG